MRTCTASQLRMALFAFSVGAGFLLCLAGSAQAAEQDEFDIFLVLGGVLASGETSVPVAYPLPDTGLSLCYSRDEPIDCPSPGEPFYGQDAQYNRQTRKRSYTVLENAVTDNVTGLLWMQADDGVARGWDDASAYCEQLRLNEYGEWRLPTAAELFAFADKGRVPAVDPVFSAQESNYWSATPHVASGFFYWSVNFSNSVVKYNESSSTFYVRCVSGQEPPELQFAGAGDGALKEVNTGLIWQDTDDGTVRGWEAALAYCENLSLAGHADWRLPDVNELAFFIDYGASQPAANAALSFHHDDAYWTSTPNSWQYGTAWLSPFVYGELRYAAKGQEHYVRCVRGGP